MSSNDTITPEMVASSTTQTNPLKKYHNFKVAVTHMYANHPDLHNITPMYTVQFNAVTVDYITEPIFKIMQRIICQPRKHTTNDAVVGIAYLADDRDAFYLCQHLYALHMLTNPMKDN